jgi:peptidoglycan hydrolase-like protein with peptidoglycan-binding domain
MRFTGALGFDGAYPIAHLGQPGIVTATGQAGTTVDRGGILYAAANRPVRLLYGAVPACRDLASGVSTGPDVRELEENLVALGMDPSRRIVVDERFTAATATAVRRWQASWGWPAAQRTGALPLGSVVFAPGALRIAQVQATVGAGVGPGAPVLTATSTNRVVTADIPVARQASIRVGAGPRRTVDAGQCMPGKPVQIGPTAKVHRPTCTDRTSSRGVSTNVDAHRRHFPHPLTAAQCNHPDGSLPIRYHREAAPHQRLWTNNARIEPGRPSTMAAVRRENRCKSG